jgi:arylformamidase
MVTCPGLPAPVICDFLSREQSASRYAPGTAFQIGRIDMVANTGTYLDTPFHRFADGFDLSELPLDSVTGLAGIAVDFTKHAASAISRHDLTDALGGRSVRDAAVLIHTGWAVHWRTPHYLSGHPFLTADAADYLADSGAQLVGIDSLNIDDMNDGVRPVHTTLLGAGIPIVEHLCGLEALPRSGFEFTAVPVKVKGMGTFPVRAYATVPR